MEEIQLKCFTYLKTALKYELYTSIKKNLRVKLLNTIKNSKLNKSFLIFDKLYPDRENLSLSFTQITIDLELDQKSLIKQFPYNFRNVSLSSYRILEIIQISNFINLTTLTLYLSHISKGAIGVKDLSTSISKLTNPSIFNFKFKS